MSSFRKYIIPPIPSITIPDGMTLNEYFTFLKSSLLVPSKVETHPPDQPQKG